MKVQRRVFDAHSHIGALGSYPYYGAKTPVNPTVIEYPDTASMIKHMDDHGVERAMIIPNYGIPDSTLSFKYNPLVIDSLEHNDRFVGAIWVSPVLKDRPLNQEAIKHAGDKGVKALKATCLLGGTYKIADWDADTKALWEELIDCCEANNLIFVLHTSPGGTSDISNLLTLIREYGKRIRIYVVHMGGGVSGNIKYVPVFFDLVKEGYKVYGDFTWSPGFGSRWMITELQERGEAWDRIMFAADTPWSDFWSEYYRIEYMNVSEELKDRLYYVNATELYESCGRSAMKAAAAK
jgi:predicted TIM-barrel fold metal-dependent hydrolase